MHLGVGVGDYNVYAFIFGEAGGAQEADAEHYPQAGNKVCFWGHVINSMCPSVAAAGAKSDQSG